MDKHEYGINENKYNIICNFPNFSITIEYDCYMEHYKILYDTFHVSKNDNEFVFDFVLKINNFLGLKNLKLIDGVNDIYFIGD